MGTKSRISSSRLHTMARVGVFTRPCPSKKLCQPQKSLDSRPLSVDASYTYAYTQLLHEPSISRPDGINGRDSRARLPFQPGPLHAPQKPAEWVPGRQVTLTALRESLSRLSTFWSLPRNSEASGGSSTASRRERQQEARASRHPRTNGSPRPILSSSRARHRASSVPLKRPGSKWRRARGRQPGCGTTRAAAAAALAKLRGYGTASSMFRCRSRSTSASTQSWNAAILGCSAATSVETT